MYKTFIFIFVVFMFASLASCGTRKEVAPAPKPEVATVPQALSSKEEWEQRWEKTLKAAQKEGSLVIYSTHGTEVRAALVPAFKKKYNIDVGWTTGRPAELTARFMAERKNGLYLLDVLFAGTTVPFQLKGQDVFEPSMEDMLILPDVVDPAQWYKNKFPWANEGRSVVSVSSLVYHFIGKNTDMVKPGDISKLNDLLDPKWKKMIIMSDPTAEGSGVTSVGMVGEYVMNWDFLRELSRQEPFITRDTRLMVEWLARGKYPVGWAPRPEPMAEFIGLKAPINYLDVPSASYLTVGGSAFTVMKNNPHPNASIIFANWLLTKEGSTLFSRARGDQSFRLDVPTDHLDAMLIRDPKKDYVSSADLQVLAKKAEWVDKAKEIFGGLLQ